MSKIGASERRVCSVIGQHRSTQRRKPHARDDEDALTAAIVRLASDYGRYGYRRITALLRADGWLVNMKRVYRIWRREGLKVPTKQLKRKRLWFNDGSCIRLRPRHRNHVWSYDFVQDRTNDGKVFRMLTVIDEFTRECLAIEVERRLRSDDALHCLARLFADRGPPDYICSYNGPSLLHKQSGTGSRASACKRPSLHRAHPAQRLQSKRLPGSAWENGYNESFNSKLRDELLNGEIFCSLTEAKVLIEQWRQHYNQVRPHSSLGYRPPAPETLLPPATVLPYAALQSAQPLANERRVLS